jgi:hypothetical protein
MTICPFCGSDPFHYEHNGLGMEAVAVDCCELGHYYFMALRHGEPETITIGWDDFMSVAGKLRRLRREEDRADTLGRKVDDLKAIISWVDTWVSNPAQSYSHDALNGLFGMTRDRIAALSDMTDHRQMNGDKG